MLRGIGAMLKRPVQKVSAVAPASASANSGNSSAKRWIVGAGMSAAILFAALYFHGNTGTKPGDLIDPQENAPVSSGPVENPQEEALWELVKDSQKTAELESYLNKYPDGKYSEQATQRKKSLQVEEARRKAEAEEKSLWDDVKDSQKTAELERYLNKYPDGKFAGEAKAKISSLKAEQALAAKEAENKRLREEADRRAQVAEPAKPPSNYVLERTLKGHSSFVLAASYSPDGLTIVTGSGDDTAKIWRAVD